MSPPAGGETPAKWVPFGFLFTQRPNDSLSRSSSWTLRGWTGSRDPTLPSGAGTGEQQRGGLVRLRWGQSEHPRGVLLRRPAHDRTTRRTCRAGGRRAGRREGSGRMIGTRLRFLLDFLGLRCSHGSGTFSLGIVCLSNGRGDGGSVHQTPWFSAVRF